MATKKTAPKADVTDAAVDPTPVDQPAPEQPVSEVVEDDPAPQETPEETGATTDPASQPASDVTDAATDPVPVDQPASEQPASEVVADDAAPQQAPEDTGATTDTDPEIAADQSQGAEILRPPVRMDLSAVAAAGLAHKLGLIAPKISVVCHRKAGRRRVGRRWPHGETLVPAEDLTPYQLEQLRGDPAFFVTVSEQD